MDREEALKLLRGGEAGVREWNKWRELGEDPPSLEEADLSGHNLSGANLTGTQLRSANVCKSNLRAAVLVGASYLSR